MRQSPTQHERRRLSRREVSAILTIGIVGIVGNGLQPTVLGSLVADGRLSTESIGLAATTQAFSSLIVLSLLGAFGRFRGLRWWALGALLALALGQGLTALAPSETGVILSRMLTGGPEGVLLWVATAGAVSSRSTIRIVSGQQVGSGILRIGLVALITAVLVPAFSGVIAVAPVAVIALLAIVMVPFLPHAIEPAEDTPSGETKTTPRRRLPAAGVIALLATAIMAPAVAVSSLYIVPIAHAAGMTSAAAVLALNAVTIGMFLGSLTAMIFGARLPYLTAFMITIVGHAVLIPLGFATTNPLFFVIAFGAIAYLGYFRFAHFYAFQLSVDRSRRTAMLNSSAVMLGTIGLQSLAAGIQAISGLQGVGVMCALLGITGIGLVLLARMLAHRQRDRAAATMTTINV